MQLAPEMACAYNDVLIVSIRGPLNDAALRIGLQDLVDRHDALRMTFAKEGKHLRITSRLTVDAPVIDLSSLTRAAQEERIDETAKYIKPGEGTMDFIIQMLARLL